MKRYLTIFCFFALLITAWQWAYAQKFWSPVLVPSPESVGRYLWEAALDG
jgi:NitT/TauT family transport system permease protein